MENRLIKILSLNDISDINFQLNQLLLEYDFEDILDVINTLPNYDSTLLKVFIYDTIITSDGHNYYYEQGYACGGLKYLDSDPEKYKFHIDLIESIINHLSDIKNINIFEEHLESFTISIDGREYINEDCPICNGHGLYSINNTTTGEIETFDCAECNGTGYIIEENPRLGEIYNESDLVELDYNYERLRQNIIPLLLK
jgi:predicted methyltransferase